MTRKLRTKKELIRLLMKKFGSAPRLDLPESSPCRWQNQTREQLEKVLAGRTKILTMGHYPIPSLTERIVDNIFESLQEGDIVVEGGMRELKAEVLNLVREEVLENANYATADKETIKAALLIARLKVERAWRQFRIDCKQLKKANLS